MRLVTPMATRSVRAALRAAATTSPTYEGVAVLELDAAPPGFALDRYDTVVGHGGAGFDCARVGLMTWATHRVPGVRVEPRSTPVSLGAVYLVTLGAPFASIAAPCRVTRVTNEPARCGFSYCTLPGHPERGKEAFDVRIDTHDDVHLDIAAVSRHAGVLVTIARPVARMVQRHVTRAYGRALHDYVRSHGT